MITQNVRDNYGVDALAMFDVYLTRWNLIPDGGPIVTRSGCLLPVRHQGVGRIGAEGVIRYFGTS